MTNYTNECFLFHPFVHSPQNFKRPGKEYWFVGSYLVLCIVTKFLYFIPIFWRELKLSRNVHRILLLVNNRFSQDCLFCLCVFIVSRFYLFYSTSLARSTVSHSPRLSVAIFSADETLCPLSHSLISRFTFRHGYSTVLTTNGHVPNVLQKRRSGEPSVVSWTMCCDTATHAPTI